MTEDERAIRDLVDTWMAASNMGDTQMTQGDLPAALTSYGEAKAAFEAIALLHEMP